jgi:hypothetical protein
MAIEVIEVRLKVPVKHQVHLLFSKICQLFQLLLLFYITERTAGKSWKRARK